MDAGFSRGKQPSVVGSEVISERGGAGPSSSIDPTLGVRLLFLACEGNLAGMEEMVAAGADVNYRDMNGRTALHIVACQGSLAVLDFLLKNGAFVDAEDRWGGTPLAEALRCQNDEVVKILKEYGAKTLIASMNAYIAAMVAEFEIDPSDIDLEKSVDTAEEKTVPAKWRALPVIVKKFSEDTITDVDKLRAFRDEVAVLRQIRHPNIVIFFGVVTQSHPMMIITEYLPKGDLCEYLRQKKSIKPLLAVRFARDIARGMNYLHEHKPEAIIHRNLQPVNILRDDSMHLKVANFGLSKMSKRSETLKEERPFSSLGITCRYMAPEIYFNEEYNTKVDVFSFSLILQEMIEGCPPFPSKQELEIPKAYAENMRPPFRASTKLYAYGLRELIEHCWRRNPADRPTFREIIRQLTAIEDKLHRLKNKVGLLNCLHKSIICKTDSASDSSNASSRNSSHQVLVDDLVHRLMVNLEQGSWHIGL
ncbi:integrin-linked protein kinase 1-like [Zingiber officinale]|nr:integrin-linked protein kinase 1-like [Zingiber officinale]XP_042416372.1 integrin-linked protein kinase 1-like [Zingiber officinale]